MTRQLLNPKPKQANAAPVGGAGKRKSKGSQRHVLLTGSQEAVVQTAESSIATALAANTSASAPSESLFRHPAGTDGLITGTTERALKIKCEEDSVSHDFEKAAESDTSAATLAKPAGSDAEQVDDDDELELSGLTEAVTMRWMKVPHEIRKFALDAPSLANFIRDKVNTIKNRPC